MKTRDPWATGKVYSGITSRWIDAQSRMERVRESTDYEWLDRVVACKDTQKTVRAAAGAKMRRLAKSIVRHAGDEAHTGGVYRSGIKVRYFRVADSDGLTRHGRHLKKGTRFWIKKSSSHTHVDRWLAQKRIVEVAS